MSNTYAGGYTRRQELVCTESEMAAYADAVLYENEKIFVRMSDGTIRMKLGDGKTGLGALPFTKVFDGDLATVEAWLAEHKTQVGTQIEGKFDKANVAQGLGKSTDKVLSQAAATKELDAVSARISAHGKRIANLEQGLAADLFRTDADTAYAKTVPADAAPYAAVNVIGGMSYKGDGELLSGSVTALESAGANLIPFPYASSNEVEMYGAKLSVGADGGITGSGTPTGAILLIFGNVTLSPGTYTASAQGEFGNIVIQIDSEDADVSYSFADSFTFTIESEARFRLMCKRTANNKEMCGTLYPMLNRGETVLPYAPYVTHEFPIPEAVQNLDGYGLGVDAEHYNKIVLDPANGVKKFVKMTKRIVFDGTESWMGNTFTGGSIFFSLENLPASFASEYSTIMTSYGLYGTITTDPAVFPRHYMGSKNKDTFVIFPNSTAENLEYPTIEAWKAYLAEQYAAGTPVTVEYALATPIETDVSEYFTDDNFIPVEGLGTLTAANEYGYAVPFEVEYMVKEADINE